MQVQKYPSDAQTCLLSPKQLDPLRIYYNEANDMLKINLPLMLFSTLMHRNVEITFLVTTPIYV